MKLYKAKRLTATLLCIVMLLSLLPISAAAAEGDYEAVESIASYSSLETLLAANPSYQGEVVRYVAPNTGDNDTEYIRVDFGVYHIGDTTTADYRFKFDPAVVTPVKADKTDISINKLNGTVNDTNKEAVLAYCNYPEGTGMGDGADLIPGTPLAGGDYSMFIKVSGPDIDLGATKTGFTGILGFSFNPITDTSMAEYISVFTADTAALNTETYDDAFYIASVYFKLNEGEEVTGETFGLYKWALNDVGGFTQIGAIANKTISLINFPAPAAPKANVDITGYGTRADAEAKQNPASGLTVELKKGADVVDTYTTGAGGKLMKDSTAVGNLKLEAGEYTCSVTGNGGTPNEVRFTITEEQATNGETVEVAVYTLGSSEAKPEYYNLEITDKDMLGKPVADDTKVSVTIDGETQECVAKSGQISVQTLPSDTATPVKVSAKGYQEQTVDVTFMNAARAGTIATVALEQTRTKIELEVPAGDGPVFVVIDKKEGGTVTDQMAMELPMTVKADETGKVTVELPDGDYTYTIKTPGAEDVEMDLDVDNTGLQNGGTETGKVTITNPEDPGKKTELPVAGDTVTSNPGTTVSGDENATGDDAALPKITDRLYSVVGEWTDNGMDVEVYLMNTNASTGTFGMTFDTSVFNPNDIAVNLDHIKYINEDLGGGSTGDDLLMGGAAGTALKNPINENGNLLFAWTADGGNSIDATSGKQLIASFSLKFADGVTKDNFENKVSDTTLDSLDFAGNTASWKDEIDTHYGAGSTAANTFAAKYWRHVDGQNDLTPVPADRLESSKALYAGFYQTYSADAESDDPDSSLAVPQDTRQQFVFQTFSGAKKLEFEVTDPAGAPVPGATVTVTDTAGNPVGTGTTDTNGKVSITIPEDTEVKYEIEKDGYKPSTGTVPVADQENVVEVVLTPDMSHKVKIIDTQTSKVQLVGGDAYNGADYLFTLEPQPGYTWPGGNMPAGGDLTIKMTATGTETEFNGSSDTLTAVWNGTLNKYVIDKSQLNFSDAGVIVIKIADPSDEPTPETTGYTVTVNSGEHGKFSYNADGNGSTFTPSGATTDLTGTLVETLTAGSGTTSAKYSFKGDGPIDDANQTLKDSNQQHEAWVIYSMSVNGTEVTLSDYQKINGVTDYQITGIDRNQAITVTYGQATVDGDVIIEGPEPDPASKANVTVILSAYGDAAVNGAAAWDGADTKTYSLDPGTFSVVFTGKANVAQPDGAAVSYEIDTVTLDGVQVNVAGNSKWTAGADSTSGTLSFLLSGGENYTVVVTFKPVGEDPIFAQLEVVNRTGNGGTVPDGTSIRDVGLPVDIEVKADSGYKLSALDLTEPGGTMQDVMPTDDPLANPYIYTTPALKAGTTVVGASFMSDAVTYKVQVDVEYASVLANAAVKAVNITFTDDAGNQIAYGPNKTGAYQLQNPTAAKVEYQLEIPEGTYNVTISKKGYLTYTITGFKIGAGGATAGSADGTSVSTAVADGIIYFGQKSAETEADRRAVAIVLGDATWDGNLIALDDIAQVANGLLNGAKAGQKLRANLTEKTGSNPTAVDMSYVINNYGKRSTNESYVDFMK